MDSRGHGRSPKPDSGWGVEHTTADLLAFLDAAGFQRVHLVGHSWGGRVVGSFAAAHPERVRTLTLEKAGRALAYLRRWEELHQRFWAKTWVEQPDGSFVHRTPEHAFRGVVEEAIFPDLTEAWQGLPELREARVAGEHAFVWSNPLDTAEVVGAFLAGRG